jgi:rSAM/selenodomain-associated transferase 1
VLGLKAHHRELCVSPDDRHPAFERVLAKADGELSLSFQGEGDLGERMNRVFERLLPGHDRALLIGTDAPALTTRMLRLAEQTLDDHDVVFVPAMDGGYALVGLTRPVPSLFHAMTWSTPQVMADTRLRARLARVKWAELPPVHDIDEPGDLVHLPAGWR